MVTTTVGLLGDCGQLARVVVVGFTVDISAAVNPDQDRFFRAGPCREDVEIEAVLGGARRASKGPEFSHLRAGVGKFRGIEQAVMRRRCGGIQRNLPTGGAA